ncbi:MAG: MFS transporter [Solirubrobacterales bacterium]|nr:MFS transporter [Solirubrobacterales bacterium]
MSAGASAQEPEAGAERDSGGLDAAFWGVFGVTFCGLIAVGAVLPVLPRYVHGPLGDGDLAVGIVIGAYAITGLLLRPVAGRLADRWGRKPTVLLGALLLCLSGLLNLPNLGIAGLIAARLVLGVGEGSLYTAGSAWIVDMAPAARRGRILGLYGLAVWGGLSVGPLAGDLLLDASSYRAVWIFAAAMPLLGAAIATQVPERFVPLAHAEPHPLIAPEALRPGFAIALASIGYAALAAFIVLLLEARGVGHGALVFGAFAAMIVLARVLAGHLPDKIGPARVGIGAALVEAAGLLTIAFSQSLPVALVGGMAMGAAFSLLNPSLMLIAVGHVSESARGAVMGTYTAFFDAGVGVGAPLAGLAAALTSYEGAFVLAAAVSVGSAGLILATLHRGSGGRSPGPA